MKPPCQSVDDDVVVMVPDPTNPCLTWPDPILHRGKGSGTWPQSNLSPRYLISHVNPVITSVMAIGKVRLATFLHS